MATPGEAEGEGRRVMAGHLEEVDIFSIAQFLMLQQKTGTLELRSAQKTGKLFFDGGKIISAQDPDGNNPEEAAFKLFQWHCGAFDFYATETAAARKIEKDSQTLLFEMAVRMDEESAQRAAALEVQPSAPGVSHPVKAKLVRPGRAAAKLVRRPGIPTAVAEQPGMSETQFMQAVQDRLTLFIDELPETSRRKWREEQAAAATAPAPSRKIGILLSMITTVILVAMLGILVVKRRSEKKPGETPPARTDSQEAAGIDLPPSYTFLTAPFTPEREAEDAIRTIPFQCTLNTIDVTGDSLEKAVVVLRKETYWGAEELRGAAEHDAAHIINNIFESPDCKSIHKIDLRVQAHVGLGSELEKWTDVLVVDAHRSFHKENIRLKKSDECSRFLGFFNIETKFR